MEKDKWRHACQVIEQGMLKATGTKTVEEAVEKIKEGKGKIGLAKEAAEAYTDLLTAVTTNDDDEKEKLLKKYTMQLVEKALTAMKVPSIYIAAAKIGWQIGSPYGQFIAEKILIIENSEAYRDALTCRLSRIGYTNDEVIVSETGRIFWFKDANIYVLRNKQSEHIIERGLQLIGVTGHDKEWVQISKE